MLKKKAKRLLAPYVIWTIIAVLAFFIGQSIPRLAPFFQNENNIVRDWNITDWINLFWTHTDNIYPLMYQFWFVRNLMIIVIVSPLLTYFAKKIPFAFIVVAILFYVNGFPLQPFFFICSVISLLNRILIIFLCLIKFHGWNLQSSFYLK